MPGLDKLCRKDPVSSITNIGLLYLDKAGYRALCGVLPDGSSSEFSARDQVSVLRAHCVHKLPAVETN